MAGPAFSLGWLMAQLFDERRLDIAAQVKAPFNPAVQLPLVADLGLAERRALAFADLSFLLESVAPNIPGDDVQAAGAADPVDEATYSGALRQLHEAILDKLVSDDQQIAAYQLGLALSDTYWLPAVACGAAAPPLLLHPSHV